MATKNSDNTPKKEVVYMGWSLGFVTVQRDSKGNITTMTSDKYGKL